MFNPYKQLVCLPAWPASDSSAPFHSNPNLTGLVLSRACENILYREFVGDDTSLLTPGK